MASFVKEYPCSEEVINHEKEKKENPLLTALHLKYFLSGANKDI